MRKQIFFFLMAALILLKRLNEYLVLTPLNLESQLGTGWSMSAKT